MKSMISTGEAEKIKLTVGIFSSASFSKILLENHVNSIQSANAHLSSTLIITKVDLHRVK